MLSKLLSFIIIGFSAISFAQITSTSPYSYYGLGEMDGQDHAIFSGLGNSTITYFDSTVLNYYNPASYNTLSKGQPIFSTGLSSRLSNYKQGDITNFNKAIIVNHFAFGLSLGKYVGVAVGLKPYSRRGYNFYETQAIGSDTVRNIYSGSGSTNELFFGLATDLIHLKKVRLSVGSNIGYVFGSVSNLKTSYLITKDSSAGISEKLTKLSAVHYQIGMFFKHILNEKHSYTLSSVIEPQQDFFNHQSESIFYASNLANANTFITLSSTGLQAGQYKIAPSLTIGFNYAFLFKDLKKGNNFRNSELSTHISYNTTDWTKFSSIYGETSTIFNLNATTKINFGVQYTPEVQITEKSAQGTFLEKTKYRFGVYQYTLPFLQSGSKITDKAFTLGFGFPVLTQRSLSSINFGFTLGARGTTNANLLSEKYYGINLGLSFAPSIFERWFIKRKLD